MVLTLRSLMAQATLGYNSAELFDQFGGSPLYQAKHLLPRSMVSMSRLRMGAQAREAGKDSVEVPQPAPERLHSLSQRAIATEDHIWSLDKTDCG